MNTQSFVNRLLDITPKEHWNTLSNLIARFSLPTIGSPIDFKNTNFSIREFDGNSLQGHVLQKFIDFTYPEDMPDRETEIELDRQYWPYASTFLVFDKTEQVAGCIQFIRKEPRNKLPVEFGKQSNGRVEFPVGSSEIYRCKKSGTLSGIDSLYVVMMMFKAIHIKAAQTANTISYLSFNPANRMLHNLYKRKCAFEESAVSLKYGSCDIPWKLLFKDWQTHSQSFATLSKSHFFLYTYCQKGLKRSSLKTPSQRIFQSTNEKNVQPILFANVIRAPKKYNQISPETNSFSGLTRNKTFAQ